MAHTPSLFLCWFSFAFFFADLWRASGSFYLLAIPKIMLDLNFAVRFDAIDTERGCGRLPYPRGRGSCFPSGCGCSAGCPPSLKLSGRRSWSSARTCSADLGAVTFSGPSNSAVVGLP